jgi:cephalosporin-C deacetylase-like acetyl esterase
MKPIDFDEFWQKTVDKLNKVPFEFEKQKEDTVIGGKKISLYKISSFDDIYFYAWVSNPIQEGKFPVKIRFYGLGESSLKNNLPTHLWFLKQNGFINMLVDIRGQGLSTNQMNPKEYIIEGLKNKENYIYRGAFMDAVRSVDFIYNNSNHNGKIIVTGGSQGGALSIVATALNKKVSLCIVSFPFLTDIQSFNKNDWPMKTFIHKAQTEQTDFFKLKKTLSYFDMLNFTENINVPIFIRTEESDTITPPDGAVKLFNAIKKQKKVLYIEPCKGHGCSTNSKVANEMEKIFIRDYLITKKE